MTDDWSVRPDILALMAVREDRLTAEGWWADEPGLSGPARSGGGEAAGAGRPASRHPDGSSLL